MEQEEVGTPRAPFFSRVALLGVGYMGGSLALAARAAGVVGRVIGYDPGAAVGSRACTLGVLDEVAPDPAAAVAGADLVILAAPVAAIADLARAIAASLPPDALVIDIGSVKQAVVQGALPALGARRFVPCHPLAGTERSGVEASDAEVYRGRPCLLCPLPETPPAAVATVTALWRAIGAQPVVCALDEHDELVAALSHLPHAVAFALARALSDGTAAQARRILPDGTLTTSLRDTTRVAASSPRVWRDIFLTNRDPLLALLTRFSREVEELRAAITDRDGDRLERLLSEGRVSRARLFPE